MHPTGNGESHNDTSGLLARASQRADQFNKILEFVGRAIGLPLIPLAAGYALLRKKIVIVPPAAIIGIVIAALSLGLVLLLVANEKRQLRPWKKALLSAAGVLCLVGGGLVLYLAPPKPAWQRLDVVKILMNREAPHDFPILVLLDQLAGLNGLIPGGSTYQTLLDAKRANELVQEQWAGYYAPLIVPSRMPVKVSLRDGAALNSANASIGVILFVWTHGDDPVNATVPKEFGYRSLQTSVTVPVTLQASQRASMFVFIYPLTAEASTHLPDRVEEAVQID